MRSSSGSLPREAGASRAEGLTVNAAGLVQGIALVTFPAASTIFTAHDSYDLSSSQYGLMFVPQVITAVTASLLGAGLLGRGLAARLGERTIYLAGLLADLAAMVLLIASWLVVHQHALAYALLLAATASLGAGFGLAVPALNTLTAAFHPWAVDRSVLVLNALLGLGTALAPLFVAVFVGLGFWTGLPVTAAVLLLALFLVSLRLPLRPGPRSAAQPQPGAGSHPGAGAAPRGAGGLVPAGFWVFGVFAVLYGFCETMNGNWSQLDITSLGMKASAASIALTAFWAVVTAGRVLFAAVQRWLPTRVTFHCLPFLLAIAFALIAALPRDAPAESVAAFGLAGLGCSALLPLAISIGQEKLASYEVMVAGGVVLPVRLRHRCVRRGPGPAAAGDLRSQRRGRRRHGPAVVRGGGRPPLAAAHAPAPGTSLIEPALATVCARLTP